ncbi:MAG: winged helix-turn-helix transcriptional regulator, partial [Thermoplasmata archaeon]|nr:winged helix-turn-helix transcriptional regulator [Thermoplasmata archaeon]
FVPLYMRMSKKDILEQYTRGEILGYIKQNPGESYNNIKRDLGMSNGKLAYHLSVLEKGRFIKSVADGMYRRYYPRKSKVIPYGRITSVQEEILRRIEETPGILQKDLSRLVGLSTATVNYHIRRLTAKGLIVSKRTGIFVHYYLDGMTVDEIMSNAIPQQKSTPATR